MYRMNNPKQTSLPPKNHINKRGESPLGARGEAVPSLRGKPLYPVPKYA
jgi:hypothetical protein